MDTDSLYRKIVTNPVYQPFLIALREHHLPTYEHSLKVARQALSFGESLAFRSDKLELVGAGAVLHDCGKLSLPLEVLNRLANLTKQERNELEGHPERGYTMLQGLDGGARYIVLTHRDWKRSSCRNPEIDRRVLRESALRKNPLGMSGADGLAHRRAWLREEALKINKLEKSEADRLTQVVSLCDIYDGFIQKSPKEGVLRMMAEEFTGDPGLLRSFSTLVRGAH